MGKVSEVDYVKNVIKVENVPADAFVEYLRKKPFSDGDVSRYLLDMGQLLHFLPRPPARVLDLGVGSGWTSEMFAWCGYEVTGLDIAPDMIAIAETKKAPHLKLTFAAYDYEDPLPYGDMDAVVIYDALHHAQNEALVVERAFSALKPGGLFICMEPGAGHSKTEDTQAAVRKYGVTEKDMPFSYVSTLLRKAGFTTLEQYVRFSQLPMFDLCTTEGHDKQVKFTNGLIEHTCHHGLTSTILARR